MKICVLEIVAYFPPVPGEKVEDAEAACFIVVLACQGKDLIPPPIVGGKIRGPSVSSSPFFYISLFTIKIPHTGDTESLHQFFCIFCCVVEVPWKCSGSAVEVPLKCR